MKNATTNRVGIQKALEFIEGHLTESISAVDVARAGGFSEFHFHRLFVAYVGESIHQYVRSRRLELAARRLQSDSGRRLLDLALDVGFETHAAFTRAFRQHFGVTPNEFRSIEWSGEDSSRPFLITKPAGTPNLETKTIVTESMWLHYRTDRGAAFGRFFESRDPFSSMAHLSRLDDERLLGFVSAFPATPNSLNDPHAEVWYGVLTSARDVSILDDLGLELIELGTGPWSTFEYQGPYEYLHQAWNQIYRGWLPNSSFRLRDSLPFEMYLNSPADTRPDELHTRIWIPTLPPD